MRVSRPFLAVVFAACFLPADASCCGCDEESSPGSRGIFRRPSANHVEVISRPCGTVEFLAELTGQMMPDPRSTDIRGWWDAVGSVASTGRGFRAGVVIAGNAGLPLGAVGKKVDRGNNYRADYGVNFHSIHPGHTTQEEDVVSSWFIGELTRANIELRKQQRSGRFDPANMFNVSTHNGKFDGNVYDGRGNCVTRRPDAAAALEPQGGRNSKMFLDELYQRKMCRPSGEPLFGLVRHPQGVPGENLKDDVATFQNVDYRHTTDARVFRQSWVVPDCWLSKKFMTPDGHKWLNASSSVGRGEVNLTKADLIFVAGPYAAKRNFLQRYDNPARMNGSMTRTYTELAGEDLDFFWLCVENAARGAVDAMIERGVTHAFLAGIFLGIYKHDHARGAPAQLVGIYNQILDEDLADGSGRKKVDLFQKVYFVKLP